MKNLERFFKVFIPCLLLQPVLLFKQMQLSKNKTFYTIKCTNNFVGTQINLKKIITRSYHP